MLLSELAALLHAWAELYYLIDALYGAGADRQNTCVSLWHMFVANNKKLRAYPVPTSKDLQNLELQNNKIKIKPTQDSPA